MPLRAWTVFFASAALCVNFSTAACDFSGEGRICVIESDKAIYETDERVARFGNTLGSSSTGSLYAVGAQGLGFIGDSVRIVPDDDEPVESLKTLNFRPMNNCTDGNGTTTNPNVTALVDSNNAAFAMEERNCVVLFTWDEEISSWQPGGPDKFLREPNVTRFGTAMALQRGVLVVSAKQEPSGAGVVFVYTQGSEFLRWSKQSTILQPGEAHSTFGDAVAVHCQTIHMSEDVCLLVVSAPGGGDPSNSGAVYVFQQSIDEFSWHLIRTLVNPRKQGQFGAALSLVANSLLIGSPAFKPSSAALQLDAAGYGLVYLFPIASTCEKQSAGVSCNMSVSSKACNVSDSTIFGFNTGLGTSLAQTQIGPSITVVMGMPSKGAAMLTSILTSELGAEPSSTLCEQLQPDAIVEPQSDLRQERKQSTGLAGWSVGYTQTQLVMFGDPSPVIDPMYGTPLQGALFTRDYCARGYCMAMDSSNPCQKCSSGEYCPGGDSPCAGELNLATWVAVVMTAIIGCVFLFVCARHSSAFRAACAQCCCCQWCASGSASTDLVEALLEDQPAAAAEESEEESDSSDDEVTKQYVARKEDTSAKEETTSSASALSDGESSMAEQGDHRGKDPPEQGTKAEMRVAVSYFQCKVCFDRPVQTVLVPCGHEALCKKCARKLTECPICRKQVTKTVRVYHV